MSKREDPKGDHPLIKEQHDAGPHLSHPSVAAIIPAKPGGPAGGDEPNVVVSSKPIDGSAPDVTKVSANTGIVPGVSPTVLDDE